MRARWLIFLLALATTSVASAQNRFSFEQLTVDNTAGGKSLTATTIEPDGGVERIFGVCRLETAQIRYTLDGTAPTTTVGTLLNIGDVLEITGTDALRAFRAIRTGADSGVLDCVLSTDVPPNMRSGATRTDEDGVAMMRQDHPDRFRCTVTVSTATTIQAVGDSCAAPGANLSLYITDIMFSASAAGIAADAFPTLKYGTGGTCGTGTTVFWGALTAAAIVAVDNRSTPIKIPANNEICWISSTAGSKFLVISGYIAAP